MIPKTQAHKAGSTEAWSKTHLVMPNQCLKALCGAKLPSPAIVTEYAELSHRGPCGGCERARLARQREEAKFWAEWEKHVDEHTNDKQHEVIVV